MPVDSALTRALSYRYLRIALVGLLLALAAAVFYQGSQQGTLGASVSGYYYTPAQTIFTGALIGLGACMIALQGLTAAEDMFLNLGGMFAIVVAVIPTGRGPDFETSVRACERGAGTLTQRASAKFDCPTIAALQAAARANVENNMAALLAVGGLALLLAVIVLFARRTARARTLGNGWMLAGFILAALVWLLGLIGLAVSVTWLAAHAHYIAAGGLAVAIACVAGANAYHRGERPGPLRIFTSPVKHLYSLLSVVMLAGTAVLVALWLTGVISLFWVEIGAAFGFVAFWSAQTVELETRRVATAKAA